MKYRDIAAVTHAKFGGRYVARGGDISVLEGDRHPKLLIIVEFPDVETIKRWYDSRNMLKLCSFAMSLSRTGVCIIVDRYKPAA